MHRPHRICVALALALCIGAPLHAQERGPTAADIGATIIPLADQLGGAVGVVTLGATLDMLSRPRFGGGIGGRVMGAIGGAAAVPSCLPGGSCIEYRSPQALFTVTAYGYRLTGTRSVRLSYGVGWMKATGGKGFEEDGTATIEVGAHYTPFRPGRRAPVFGVSVVRGLRATGGVQTMVLPSVGLRF